MPLPLLPSPHVFLSVVAHLIASPSGRYPSQGRERYLFALKNIYIGSRRIIVTFYHRVYLYNLRITSIFEFSSPREPRVVKEEMEGGLAFEAKGKRGRGIRSLAEFTHDRVETRACIGLRPRKDQDFTGESTFPTKGSEREQVSRSRNRGNLLFLLRFIYIYICTYRSIPWNNLLAVQIFSFKYVIYVGGRASLYRARVHTRRMFEFGRRYSETRITNVESNQSFERFLDGISKRLNQPHDHTARKILENSSRNEQRLDNCLEYSLNRTVAT